MDGLNKIFDSKGNIDAEKLKKYLNDELAEDEKHAVEEAMADSPFVNDAVEGLQEISGVKKRDELVEQINKSLHNNLRNKKSKRSGRKIKNIWWIMLTVFLILLFAAISILFIKWYREKENSEVKLSAVSNSIFLQNKSDNWNGKQAFF